jgi:hypothetical protein
MLNWHLCKKLGQMRNRHCTADYFFSTVNGLGRGQGAQWLSFHGLPVTVTH